MARLSFKPDADFFRKIAIGAVGARAVAADLTRLGHHPVELEPGATDTKLWKDVKRKRVRIPDLVCLQCGARIESRAKTQPEISMSHSFSDETRSWDAGMVGDDWIAFPVCSVDREEPWSLGRFNGKTSYWQEKSWTEWRSKEHINYFLVKAFRETPYRLKTTKGVTEGSETAISWNATFSTSTGEIEEASSERIMIRRAGDGRLSPRRIGLGQSVRVAPGQRISENEVLASTVPPLRRSELSCRGALGKERLSQFLYSRERTQRSGSHWDTRCPGEAHPRFR